MISASALIQLGPPSGGGKEIQATFKRSSIHLFSLTELLALAQSTQSFALAETPTKDFAGKTMNSCTYVLHTGWRILLNGTFVLEGEKEIEAWNSL